MSKKPRTNSEPPNRPATRADAATRKCRDCGEPIAKAAIKCKECGAYQDFRRYLFSGESAAVAVVAIGGALGWISGGFDWIRTKFPPEITVDLPVCNSQAIRVEVTNSGGRPIRVGPPSLRIESPRRRRPLNIAAYLQGADTHQGRRIVSGVAAPAEQRQVPFDYGGAGARFFGEGDAVPNKCRLFVDLPLEGLKQPAHGSCPCGNP